MPILSNSVVTRPLSEAELKACNFRSQTFMTDTRTLRFYYRLLPDNRLQIGSRSAVTGADAEDPVHEKLLTDAIARKFPPLAGIAIDHSWWGWVDVSHDMMPRIVQPDPARQLWYALGYGGNGVSFSHQAGQGWPSASPARTPAATSSSCRSIARRCRIRTCSTGWIGSVRAVPAPRPAGALQVVLAA